MKPTHAIREHNIRYTTYSQEMGLELNSQISNLLQQEFYPRLEVLMDTYSVDSKLIKIPLLEINVKTSNRNNWKEETVLQSLHEIEKRLQSIYYSVQPQDKKLKDEKNDNFNSEAQFIEPTSFSVQDKEQSLVHLLLQFLQYGLLPSNAFSNSLEALSENWDWHKINLREFAKNICDNKTVLKRWVINAPEKLKLSLASEHQFSLQTLEEWIEKEVELQQNNSTLNNDTLKETIVIAAWRYVFEAIAQDEVVDIISIQSNTQHGEFLKTEERELYDSLSNGNFVKENSPPNVSKEESITLEKVYCNNAGLIIFHPFLKEFFEINELMKEGNWIDQKSQERAVILTEYLVSKKELCYENELVLNKLICGLQPTGLVRTRVRISEKEKQNCEELNSVVISHWKKLKDTSIETFRESFLKRKGILQQDEYQNWQLLVESKGIDLLLNYLPWGFSEIQLPWMQEKIICNWG